MQEQQRQLLAATFSDTLADLAFMFADDEPTPVDPKGAWVEVSVSYHGPIEGEVRLRCTEAFSVMMAANLLGVAPEDEPAHDEADDALKEFLNVLCGHVVTAIHGTHDVFSLSIPSLRHYASPPASWDQDPDAVEVTVQGEPVRVVYLAQSSCTAGT